MCNNNALQQKIRKHTDNGDLIAQFLADTIRGEYPDARYHHKLEAAKLLSRYGSSDEDEPHFWGLMPTPEELAEEQSEQKPPLPQGEGWGEGENPPHPVHPVSYLDILNYEIAHLIRQETAEGHTIAEFLSHVMTRRDRAYTSKKLRIRHTDRMAAAREILRRGHGHFGRKRKLVVDDHGDNNYDTNGYDTLHTDLAKRMREYSEHGTDAVRFLLDVMSAADPDEAYTWHHRMSAAQELLRRGWDTNYDRITPEMLQDYWRNQQSTRLSIGQKKHLAGLPTTLDDHNTYDNEDYQALADAIRQQEDREAISPIENSPLSLRERVRVRVKSPAENPSKNPAERENGNPVWQGAGTETTNPFVLSLSKDESASSPHNTEDNTSSLSCPSMSVPPDDDTPDCYHEPLNPEKQAIFDYQCKIESGEYKEGEITIRQPTPEDWKLYKDALQHITELAAAEGVPLLPNPLAGKLRAPNIRSP